MGPYIHISCRISLHTHHQAGGYLKYGAAVGDSSSQLAIEAQPWTPVSTRTRNLSDV